MLDLGTFFAPTFLATLFSVSVTVFIQGRTARREGMRKRYDMQVQALEDLEQLAVRSSFSMGSYADRRQEDAAFLGRLIVAFVSRTSRRREKRRNSRTTA